MMQKKYMVHRKYEIDVLLESPKELRSKWSTWKLWQIGHGKDRSLPWTEIEMWSDVLGSTGILRDTHWRTIEERFET